MTDLWILIWIFSSMHSVHPGSRRVSAQTHTEPPVYQPDDQISVDIGHSATLRCCISANVLGIIDLFKQPNGKKPQILVTLYKSGGETFYNKFQQQKTRFRIERSFNCFHLIILTIIQSDEAVYYCALKSPSFMFADGTSLKIKGTSVLTTPSETSEPALCAVCEEATRHGNNANIAQDKAEGEMIRSLHGTTLGLGTALGLCVLLISALIYFILRRRKCENSKLNTSIHDSSGKRQKQESEADAAHYAALRFHKRKDKGEQKTTALSDECVYADVNTTVVYAINDS